MTDNLPELQAAAFDKYAAENINTVFSGRIYSHQAPFYMLLFRAGWDAAIASERARADALEAALLELVECKDMHDEYEKKLRSANSSERSHGESLRSLYLKRKPIAWAAARSLLEKTNDR